MGTLTKKELGKVAFHAMYFGIRPQGYFRKLGAQARSANASSLVNKEMTTLVRDVNAQMGKVLALKAKATGLPSGLTISNVDWTRAIHDANYRRTQIRAEGPVAEKYAGLIFEELRAADAAMASLAQSKGLKHV